MTARGCCPGDQPRRLHEGSQVAPHLRGPASGQEGHPRRGGIQPVSGQELLQGGIGMGRVHEGMAHEDRLHPMLAQEDFLEGKDHEGSVHEPPEELRPLLSPGPHLGGDVVDHGYAEPAGVPGEAEVEIGEIHQHQGVGASCPEGGFEPAHLPHEVGQVGEHLGDAHHGQLLHGHQDLDPRGGEDGPARSKPLGIRGGRREGPDQVAAVCVSRMLARHDGEPVRPAHWHLARPL